MPEDSTACRTTLVTDSELTTRLLAFLQGRTGSAPETARDLPAADPALVERLRAAHAEALPGRLAAIAGAARAGDAEGPAAGATALAGSSGQLGDPAVARLSGALARQIRRGVLAHALVTELTAHRRPVVAGPRDGQAASR